MGQREYRQGNTRHIRGTPIINDGPRIKNLVFITLKKSCSHFKILAELTKNCQLLGTLCRLLQMNM